MTANQAEYPSPSRDIASQYPAGQRMMSRTLGVSRSGFYAHHSRPPSARSISDDALSQRIAKIHKASKEAYGAPRIHAELADENIHVGCKRVERLMKAKGLRGVSRRKFVVTTERDPRVRPASDLVDRNFYAPSRACEHALPGKGCAKCTLGGRYNLCADHCPAGDCKAICREGGAGFLYLAVVLDAFSRRIIGWAMGNTQKAQLVIPSH